MKGQEVRIWTDLSQGASELPPMNPLPMTGLIPIEFGPEVCQDLSLALTKEWLATNGLGGYASSTILGMNTRRYHGLLVAATHPPVGRVVLLSKVEETLVVHGGRYELSTNRYAHVIHPEGYRYLVGFRLDPWPCFFFKVGSILLEKSVFLLPGENATVIGYTLHEAPSPVELVIRPLLALRDFRWVSQENPSLDAHMEKGRGVLTVHPYEGMPPLMIHHTAELVEESACWYKSFEYSEESSEEAKVREDLWSCGQLLYLLKPSESCALVASTGRRGMVDLTFHRRRLQNTQTVLAQTMTPPGKGELSRRLAWTADSFLARPGPAKEEAYLMAGFPWFSSWGRDALIALVGLTLVSKRFDLARQLLLTLAGQIKNGLVPVRFAEEDASAEYDSADCSLWFIWAVWHFLKRTRDLKFIAKKLLKPMQQIVEAYLEGTSFGIGMDEDGLILLSDEEIPLTWMDARLLSAGKAQGQAKGTVPGKAVTPRFGKPVEINALWFCALQVMGRLAHRLELRRAKTYLKLARLVRQRFAKSFTDLKGTLYDRVTPSGPDATLRPNMLIAASLPFSPVSKPQAAQILEVVERHLLTPVGIRTLSPTHPEYRGRYEGDLASRALAYHQGTVWAWLLGPYVSTVIKVRGLTPSTRKAIRRQLEPFLTHLKEGALGSVSELFDGDPPHLARGGISQAWSVGEILRAIDEAELADL